MSNKKSVNGFKAERPKSIRPSKLRLFVVFGDCKIGQVIMDNNIKYKVDSINSSSLDKTTNQMKHICSIIPMESSTKSFDLEEFRKNYKNAVSQEILECTEVIEICEKAA